MQPVLTLTGITKLFDERGAAPLRAVSNVSLTVMRGEFLVLLGPSGCGKSTLLRIMSGLVHPTRGTRTLATDVPSERMSFVFQQFALLPWLTVEENVGLGLVARGMAREDVRRRVDRELRTFGLTKFRAHFPHDLSGGMRQRAGIARALATDPSVLFMDEPFSELDSFIAAELRENLLHIWKERKLTVVMVSHNIQESIELADRIVVMTPRPGRIERIVQNPLPRPRALRTPECFALEDRLLGLVKP